jgi:hypothetical protein
MMRGEWREMILWMFEGDNMSAKIDSMLSTMSNVKENNDNDVMQRSKTLQDND